MSLFSNSRKLSFTHLKFVIFRTSGMQPHHPYLMDYIKFMAVFKRMYPELHDKYKDCIDMPVDGGFRLFVNNRHALSSATKQTLNQVIEAYYQGLNN